MARDKAYGGCPTPSAASTSDDPVSVPVQSSSKSVAAFQAPLIVRAAVAVAAVISISGAECAGGFKRPHGGQPPLCWVPVYGAAMPMPNR